ncbi:MAG: LLM class flavin-dependent oxidoreductase [Gaiellaceae bacterium]
MELGIYTFAELTSGLSPAERLRNLLEEVELADEVGLDVFGVGEHHRPDFAVSAPAIVLAAAAARTKRIRLTSAVTVLSSDDPIRVFQQFATLDLVSGGRAEIMAGRGSFIESFPLFGYDLADYDRLFDEKLRQLLALREDVRGVYPRPLQEPLPVWVAVGGSPESAHRAGALGLPMALAIIGGLPERFVPFADVHRRAAAEAGHGRLPLSINSHGFVAETSQRAADEYFTPLKTMMDRIGRERGWRPLTRQDYDAGRTLRGATVVGSPEEVAEKILFQHELFGHERFLIQFTVGSLPHASTLKAIELFGTKVAPLVREEVSRRAGTA